MVKDESAIKQLTRRIAICHRKAGQNKENWDKSEKRHTEYENHNSDFRRVCLDAMENNDMFMLLTILAIVLIIDFATLYHALQILCTVLGLPVIFKFIVPSIIAFIEVGVSYFTNNYQNRDYGNRNWLAQCLPYFVIVLLIGMSTLVICYSAINILNENASGIRDSMWGNIIWQGLLLLTSVIMHLWLIRHSDQIVLAIAYYRYKLKSDSYSNDVNAHKKKHKKYFQKFVSLASYLSGSMDKFYKTYPDSTVDFSAELPNEVQLAINKVMGRSVFIVQSDNNVFEQQKIDV